MLQYRADAIPCYKRKSIYSKKVKTSKLFITKNIKIRQHFEKIILQGVYLDPFLDMINYIILKNVGEFFLFNNITPLFKKEK